MTNEAKLFNEKYGLAISDASFVKVDIDDFVSVELSGKPKKNWKEVIKRFATNPFAMGSLILFLAIFLFSYITILSSPWDGNQQIYGDIVGKEQFWLPSTEFNSTITKSIEIAQAEIWQEQWGIKMTQVGLDSGGKAFYEFNPWDIVKYKVNVNGLSPSSADLYSVMGTDGFGYDIWTRTWTGTARSIEMALMVVVCTTVIGTLIGSWIGMKVGTVADILVMKILSVYNSVPTFVWYSIMLFIMPKSSMTMFVVFFLTGWQRGLGTARSQMWRYINTDFMKAAETIGVSKFGRILKHALPNYAGYIAIVFVQSIPSVISAEASLKFLYPSIIPDRPSLGNIINEATSPDALTQSNYVLLPAMIIMTISLSMHFVAIGLNDAFEPKFKGGSK